MYEIFVTAYLISTGMILNRIRGGMIEGFRIPAIIMMGWLNYFCMIGFVWMFSWTALIASIIFTAAFTTGWYASLNPFVEKSFEGKETWYKSTLLKAYKTIGIFPSNFLGLLFKGLTMYAAYAIVFDWRMIFVALWLPVSYTIGYAKSWKCNMAEWLFGIFVVSGTYIIYCN